jgi:hypothetical protein
MLVIKRPETWVEHTDVCVSGGDEGGLRGGAAQIDRDEERHREMQQEAGKEVKSCALRMYYTGHRKMEILTHHPCLHP